MTAPTPWPPRRPLPKALRETVEALLRQYPLARSLAAEYEARRQILDGEPAEALARWYRPYRLHVEAVEALLASLSPLQRRLIELRYFQNQPWQTVAEALHMEISPLFRHHLYPTLWCAAFRFGLVRPGEVFVKDADAA